MSLLFEVHKFVFEIIDFYMWYQNDRLDTGSLIMFPCSKPKFEHEKTSQRIVMIKTTTSKVAVQGIFVHRESIKKKKKKNNKRVSGGDEIVNTENSKVNEGSRRHETALVNSDDYETRERENVLIVIWEIQ